MWTCCTVKTGGNKRDKNTGHNSVYFLQVYFKSIAVINFR